MARRFSSHHAGDARILCGFPPGGTADLLCRILADALKSEIGHNVIVETKSGASGFIANEALATAAPDGRTVGLVSMASMCVSPVMPGQKLPINVDTDMTPIANVAGVYNMLVAGKHAPFRTIPELIVYAKANPGKLTYASSVYDGFLWNFEGNEFVLLDGNGFRNWFKVESRVSERLLFQLKVTRDHNLPNTYPDIRRFGVEQFEILNPDGTTSLIPAPEPDASLVPKDDTLVRLQLDYTF